ncbi:MAG: hypothetical protein ACXV8Q_19525, partial [Methylobacter sp.]
AAVAAIVHYFWQLKGNLAEPLFYSIVVFLLLSFRILVWVKNRQFSRMMIPTGQRILAVAEKQGVMPVVIRKRR